MSKNLPEVKVIQPGDMVKLPFPFFDCPPVTSEVVKIEGDKVHVKTTNRIWNRGTRQAEYKECITWYYSKNVEKL